MAAEQTAIDDVGKLEQTLASVSKLNRGLDVYGEFVGVVRCNVSACQWAAVPARSL